MSPKAIKGVSALIIVSLSVVIVSTIGSYMLHQRVLDRMQMFDDIAKTRSIESQIMSSVSETWKIGPNKTKTVTTTQQANEGFSAMLIRHAAEVADAMIAWPEDC